MVTGYVLPMRDITCVKPQAARTTSGGWGVVCWDSEVNTVTVYQPLSVCLVISRILDEYVVVSPSN